MLAGPVADIVIQSSYSFSNSLEVNELFAIHDSVMNTLTIAAIQGRTCVEDTGWWCTAQNGFESLMVKLHGIVEGPLGIKENTYGWTIILFTFLCRMLTFPLNYISYASSDRVKALKPYMEKIKERYAEDQTAQNIATAKLYEMSATNPLAGCLPSIAQIPVFIFLYRSVLNLAFENELNEPFFWLPSLEGPTFDAGRGIGWLTENWVDGTPSLGWHDTLCYLLVPIALVITQSLSMQIMQPPVDPNDEGAVRTQRILKYLPLMIGWFSANVPAGLGLYWMTSNLVSVGSSVATKAYLKANPPELDIKLADLGLDDGSAGVKLPNTIEEAIAEAKINAAPDRTPRRPGLVSIARVDLDLVNSNLEAFPSRVQNIPSSPSLPSSTTAVSNNNDDDEVSIETPTAKESSSEEVTAR